MITDFFSSVRSIVGDNNFSTASDVLEQHSRDASVHSPVLPEAVIFPKTTIEVSSILKLANTNMVSVTVCGAQTSLEGNAIPVKGGVVLDMTFMNRVIKILPNDLQVIVEPGIIGDSLNSQLIPYHLYFPAFPASSHLATIGGMIANNAGGMYAVRYGVVGNWVMALEVVLADGKVITVGSGSIKSVAGYDLKSLFVASEGTLGVITKATLRLVPQITSKFLMLASFQNVQDALDLVLEILHNNINPAALEFLDERSVYYINKARSLGWVEKPTILIELHGQFDENEKKASMIKTSCQKHNTLSFITAKNPKEQKRIWDGRKCVRSGFLSNAANLDIFPGDIGIPISGIVDFMKFVETTSQKYQIPQVAFGHIGDGNIHVWLSYEKNNNKSFQLAQNASAELVNKALELRGTSTAEHGVGIGKRIYLEKEHQESIYLMKELKKIFDPNGILNPGKIFL